MNSFLQRAIEIKDELIANRRFLHKNAEIRDDLPITVGFVKEKLNEYGVTWKEISKCGIVGLIGGKHAGKTIMLRADMDALAIKEESGLPFACQNGYGHCCGHDLHTAMLLGAAKMLKEQEDSLYGTVKLMFQPGEEYFIGAQAMIEGGVLHDPKVDAAVDIHMNARNPVGSVAVCRGYTCASCDGMKLTVKGKGCHGAWPHTGIDPINVAAHTYLSLQELIAREAPADQTVTLTFGQFSGGSTANIIPQEVVMQGTMRTFDPTLRERLKKRIHEVVEHTALAFGAQTEYEILSDVPSLYTEPALLEELMSYCKELDIHFIPYPPSSASDDFARITEHVPCAFFSLGCKPEGDGPTYPPHNPKIVFNEDALPIGAALHATCAYEYLSHRR